MKFITSVDLSFSFKKEFDEHIKKFDLKHQQELLFLDDVENFMEKRSKLHIDLAKAERELCEQFLQKKYKLIDENDNEVLQNVSGRWKIFLEQLQEICEKRLANSYYVTLFYKEYQDSVRKQKTASHERALKDIRKVQAKIQDIQTMCQTAFKRYCFEEYLNDRLNMRTTNRYFNQAYFESRLKEKSIDTKYFNSKFEEIYSDPNQSVRIRTKQVDLTKLNYLIHNSVLNQSLQHYISSYLPEMLVLDNGHLDVFIDELTGAVKVKEAEISRMILDTFNERNLASAGDSASNADQENDWAYSNRTVSFQHLTQFHLETYNPDKEDFSTATLKSEHAKYFTYDYHECISKLNRLEQEINQLSLQYQPLQAPEMEPGDEEAPQDRSDSPAYGPRFIIDSRVEEDKYKLNDLKFQTVALQARIDVLESLEIIKEIEKNDNVIYTYGEILHSMSELEDLLVHQCLFYVESYIRTIDKPFPDMKEKDDYELLYESWL